MTTVVEAWDAGKRPVAKGASYVLRSDNREFTLMRAGKETAAGKSLRAGRGWEPRQFNADLLPRRTPAETRIKNIDGSESVLLRTRVVDGKQKSQLTSVGRLYYAPLGYNDLGVSVRVRVRMNGMDLPDVV